MMTGYGMPFGWGGMWLGPILMIAVVVLAVLLLIWIIRLVAGTGGGAPKERPGAAPSAREILDARLARGEIDQEEYDRRRRALES